MIYESKLKFWYFSKNFCKFLNCQVKYFSLCEPSEEKLNYRTAEATETRKLHIVPIFIEKFIHLKKKGRMFEVEIFTY